MKRSSNALHPAVVALVALVAAAVLAAPAAGQPPTTHTATFDLYPDRTAYEPGQTVRIAARIEIEEGWHVNSNTPSYEYLIPTELTFELAESGIAEPRVTYPAHRMQKFEFTEEPIAVYDGRFVVLAELELPADHPAGLLGLAANLRYQACDHQHCLPPVTGRHELEITIGPGGVSQNEAVFAAFDAGGEGSDKPEVAAASLGELAWVLFLGLVGGLLLNAMPCVLPVLSLKVFGLVKSGGLGRSHLVTGSLATAAGILISFWALAAAAVGMKIAGEAVGWGMQFQQPGFVTFLAVVVVLFSLNMWGLFEINLPGSVMQVGGASAREGLGGHFLSGLFATLMATPCSAPFLGTAVGFALVQSPLVIFAIFTAIGLGLGLPYLLLAAVPGLVSRVLPKPGNWMVTFKHVMGFLLAAAAVWLFYVLAAQVTAEYLAFIQLAILGLALGAWLFRDAEGRTLGRGLAGAGMAAAAVLAVVLAVQSPAPATASGHESGYHQWVAFDETEALRLSREEGRFVFVDVTADWCVTCKTIERLVLETPEVGQAFEDHDVVAMKADWTNRDDRITDFLASHGKAAVPFYVLYRPGGEARPFGEVVTKASLLEALENADVASLDEP